MVSDSVTQQVENATASIHMRKAGRPLPCFQLRCPASQNIFVPRYRSGIIIDTEQCEVQLLFLSQRSFYFEGLFLVSLVIFGEV
jgi:hypothetical protein